MKSIQIHYYAVLAEHTQCAEEQFSTDAHSLDALWLEIKDKYKLKFEHDFFRAAKNHSFCSWQEAVEHGDIISFIPPVSGG